MGKNAQAKIPWAELPVFLALAQKKTLSGAARQLGIDRTTVARRIDSLEAELERALFDRLNGKFELTQLGRKAFAATERANQELAFFDKAKGGERHPLGKVRLSLPAYFSISLVEMLTRFQRDNPEILLELTATDRRASLQRYETDVALRLSRHPPRGLESHILGNVSYRLYQSADALPDLKRYITYPGAGRTDPVIRKLLPDAEITMSVDGYIPLREYIAQGVGIGLLPSAFGDQDPRLVPASEELFEGNLKLWLLCLPEQKRLRRVQTLMRFLRRELTDLEIG